MQDCSICRAAQLYWCLLCFNYFTTWKRLGPNETRQVNCQGDGDLKTETQMGRALREARGDAEVPQKTWAEDLWALPISAPPRSWPDYSLSHLGVFLLLLWLPTSLLAHCSVSLSLAVSVICGFYFPVTSAYWELLLGFSVSQGTISPTSYLSTSPRTISNWVGPTKS